MPIPDGAPPLVFGYTNWRGEFSSRRAVPIRIFFGATEHHPEPQWLMEAQDLDKGAVRIFAVREMLGQQVCAAHIRRVQELASALEALSAERDAMTAQLDAIEEQGREDATSVVPRLASDLASARLLIDELSAKLAATTQRAVEDEPPPADYVGDPPVADGPWDRKHPPVTAGSEWKGVAQQPAGWKRVPVEATPEMIRAAGDAFLDSAVGHVAGDIAAANTPFRRWYRALLAASPPPPAAAAEGWRPISEAAKAYPKVILGWDDSAPLPMHWEIGRWSDDRGFWLNNYGHAFAGAPTHYWVPPAPPSRRG